MERARCVSYHEPESDMPVVHGRLQTRASVMAGDCVEDGRGVVHIVGLVSKDPAPRFYRRACEPSSWYPIREARYVVGVPSCLWCVVCIARDPR